MSQINLTNISLEIRDLIIELVITTRVSVPRRPAQMLGRLKSVNPDINPLSNEGYIANSLSLLLVNRQLHAETKAAIGRFLKGAKEETEAGKKRRNLTYTYDIMLVDDSYVWPSHICVPALSSRVDNAVVTIQAFGTCPVTKTSLSGVNAFRSDMGPSEVQWAFYRPLVNLLRDGPGTEMWTSKKPTQRPVIEALSQPGGSNRGITVGTLILDFQKSVDNTITDYIFFKWAANQEGGLFQPWKECRGMPSQIDGWEDVHRIVIRPEWLVSYLTMRLSFMLGMSYHTSQYSSVLFERIGKIEIRLDGANVRVIHIAEKLERLNFNHPRDTFGHLPSEERIAAFQKWKKEVIQLRKDRGLPVVE
ncbi:hypothetical protein H112_04427 [Trichophyton rubrum D6]|uniref:Uncharacterized protein n=4 Tax=Trichophyton TaxID=5550 RepID=A0A178F4N0_TRIRU|nr:uncharacterized protein TERG_04200 [Trichophyton rubrum CBS 118892]EZF22947.1 hypothetical protein H100_04436 [Trichophyton rubrum MR850]EZF41773.1 hypothetical protein H102_04420 [Trichophyton rubrum CBS 100081]EZF52466.1 hypothetical protein H103_04430 [Trichophyton rubrum CBS 288.86]EZF63048.1 hypothetical protein H104_04418 [Trichophyton rubrum CBS 289.86]EZF73799.1 hypothetical protein H105_04444 [Trichophyton soudanense CBS 452.61]EZF84355.1 hypothetical protein H110_04422 [Trichophy